jgi:phosphoribosylformimino-5-aminoimidazole carboxamide ribotide isomerase
MLIIPAVDIKNGKCVRLVRGDFNHVTIYSDNPVEMAKRWKTEGAKVLHVVDLDGAKNGKLTNLVEIKEIAQEVKIPLQIGGGIRDKETIKTLLSLGIDRVILGTVALENKKLLQEIVKDFSFQLAIALDTKNGKLMKQGWFEDSDKNYVTTALELEDLGIQRFIYTDVVKDGTLTEPNYNEIANLIKNVSVPVIASGGVSSLSDIKQLKSIGVEGVIIGKALYEGEIDLKEAINVS